MRTRTALLLCALAAAPLACAPAERRDPGVVVVAVRSAPIRLDPRLGNDEASMRVAQLVYSPLLDFGDDLRPRPALAERLDTPDQLTYIVHLRRGVRFHDGRELTSRDVVYTFRSVLDPALSSPFRGAYKLVRSITALDDLTVEFKLSEPFAAFPTQLVNNPPVVPDGAGTSLSTRPN